MYIHIFWMGKKQQSAKIIALETLILFFKPEIIGTKMKT